MVSNPNEIVICNTRLENVLAELLTSVAHKTPSKKKSNLFRGGLAIVLRLYASSAHINLSAQEELLINKYLTTLESELGVAAISTMTNAINDPTLSNDDYISLLKKISVDAGYALYGRNIDKTALKSVIASALELGYSDAQLVDKSSSKSDNR